MLSKEMLSQYMAILPELLKNSPEIEIKELSFKTKDGDFIHKLKINIDGTNAKMFTHSYWVGLNVTPKTSVAVAFDGGGGLNHLLEGGVIVRDRPDVHRLAGYIRIVGCRYYERQVDCTADADACVAPDVILFWWDLFSTKEFDLPIVSR